MKKGLRALATLILIFTGSTASNAQNVMINEAGYLPDQAKFVYTTQPCDSFVVVSMADGQAHYRGKFVVTRTNDPATGLSLCRGDFSSLTEEGMYRITTSAAATSIVFPISWTAFEDVYKKALKGFYFQRCGVPILSQNAGPYARQICHVNDGVFHSTTGKSGSRLTTGGWHDAGDYGKYTVNAGITVGTLLFGYELFPSKFAYDNLNIPESGNGVPDLLDEVRFELEWLLTMQDSADGGVYHKVTTANFDGFEMPSQDVSTRYIYQKSSTGTGDFAGMMAQAARIYAPFDAAFAGRCLAAARAAWNFLQGNPTIVPVGGFRNPSGTSTGEYGDGSDSDERLWAAAELYETTGEATYRTYFEAHYTEGGLIGYAMGWQNLRTFAQLVYLFGHQTGTSTTVRTQLQNSLISYCGSLYNLVSQDGLNVALSTGDYYWGSNSVALNNGILLICGYMLTLNQNYYTAALQQLNYVLGCNGPATSYVTGIGAPHPLHIHHRPSAADGVFEPVPGLLAGGPDKYLDDDVLRAHYTSSTPPALCYIDDQGSYASNEICINWNAPLVFVAGYLNESPVTSVAGSKVDVPSQFELAQNYPNPFNPFTTIKYTIAGARDLGLGARKTMLVVYDVLGRQVATLVNEEQAPGSYQVRFDGSGLASGIYIYRLTAGSFVQSKKMVLLK